MELNRNLKNEKATLLHYFRNRANETLSELALRYSVTDYKEKATAINHALVKSKDNLISTLLEKARREQWQTVDILECILMITYTSDVVMLETRNSVWEYDYMAFSRRVGELWESFCKLCFQYPINNIRSFVPPLFADVKRNLTDEIDQYIASLTITREERVQLRKYYDKVWGLVTSGEIQLECDLHFTDGTTKYVVDFKSGFGSNEKGNANRLLLVGSIYNNIDTENYRCMLFVRSADKNHYLNTLKNSGVWSTFCGEDTYQQISDFTGYNAHDWINRNIDWMNDFTPEMRSTVQDKELENYLDW